MTPVTANVLLGAPGSYPLNCFRRCFFGSIEIPALELPVKPAKVVVIACPLDSGNIPSMIRQDRRPRNVPSRLKDD